MNDRYQLFANSPAGRLLSRNLGLPAPLVLDRFDASKPLVNGAVLLGAAPNAELIAPIAKVLKNIHAELMQVNLLLFIKSLRRCRFIITLLIAVKIKIFKFKAFVFDASGIKNSEQLVEVYNFFHPIARQLQNCGRVVILGRTPESCTDPKQATAQRALEGFVPVLLLKNSKKPVPHN
jgi:3-oxoacyl-[acyl-carrier protein] reductase